MTASAEIRSKPLSTSSKIRYLGRMDMARTKESLRCSPLDSCRAGISKSRSSMWVSSMSSPMRSRRCRFEREVRLTIASSTLLRTERMGFSVPLAS